MPNHLFDLNRRTFINGLLSTGILLPSTGFASIPTVNSIHIRSPKGKKILNQVLKNTSYWANASINKYKKQKYDEIRLKDMGDGYLTMISGEGLENFTQQQVASTVFWHLGKLARHIEGAIESTPLHSGNDPITKAPYTDSYMLADFDFFYGEYFQRIYQFILNDGRIVCPFELIKPTYVTAAQWQKYGKTSDNLRKNAKLRWAFNSFVPISEFFGMYIIEPGTNYKTRVTLIARLQFGAKAGFIAKIGSKIPFVLRSGLQSGFDGCVNMAKQVKLGKYKKDAF